MGRLPKVLGIAIAFVVFAATPALADCHSNGVDSGSQTVYLGGTGSNNYQYGAWQLANKRARLAVNTSTMSGACREVDMDWMTTAAINPGHYDRRSVRNCDDLSYRETNQSSGWTTEPSNWGGRTVSGLQKAAAWKVISTSFSGAGLYFNDSVLGCPFTGALAFGSNSQRMFIRYSTGTVDYYDGGNVASPTS